MSLIIRAARAVDIPRIAWIETYYSDNSWSEAQLREELDSPHAHLLCCVLDGVVVGFCDLHIVMDDAHINEICVADDYRRRGFARAMLAHTIALCAGAGCAALSLEVRSQNKAAIALYAGFGFVRAGIRRRFYRDPDDDALNMILYFDTVDAGGE